MMSNTEISSSQALAQGCTISDLHIFTNRSTAKRYAAAIHKAARSSRLFVLNGDLFDFPWVNRKAEAHHVVKEALHWIVALVDPHPDCHFVVLIGNHDCLPLYKKGLEEISRDRANLQWDEYYFRLGPKVFLHGDAYNAGPTNEALDAYREKWATVGGKSTMKQALYYALARAGVPATAPHLVPRRRVARRLTTYLRNCLGPEFAGIKEVFFGHTHTEFQDFEHAGLLFHNSGAAVLGSRLRPRHFTFTRTLL